MIMTLDFASDIPIYQQIRNALVHAISEGTFSEGDKLPTVRRLAEEAGINVMTVNKAYQLMKQEGYIVTDRRNGAIVCKRQLTEEQRSRNRQKLAERLALIVDEAKIEGISEEELAEELRKLYQV